MSKGAGNPDVMIPEGSEIENTITGKLGAGRKDWVQWQGDTYRVLEFWTTDNPKVPFMVKLRKYAKEYRRGKMRNKASYEWLISQATHWFAKDKHAGRYKGNDRKQPDAVKENQYATNPKDIDEISQMIHGSPTGDDQMGAPTDIDTGYWSTDNWEWPYAPETLNPWLNDTPEGRDFKSKIDSGEVEGRRRQRYPE